MALASGDLFGGSSILACSVCTTAIADHILPPIAAWATIGTAWFLLTATLASVRRQRIPGHPTLSMAAVVMLLLVALAGVAAGLGVGVFLIGPPALAFVRSLLGRPSGFADPTLRRWVRWLGGFATVAIVIAGAQSWRVHSTRTEGEFIVEWEGAGVSRAFLRALRPSEPRSLADYRYVVAHGDLLVGEAATRIAEIGDATDLALLEHAAARDPDRWNADELTSAIAKLRARLDAEKRKAE